jgi:uncharacterized protein YihD (DUF1040 family)
LFYEHAGILLNLGESLSPVLIAKVQHGAPHPQNVLEKFTNPGDEWDEDFGPDLASSFDSDEDDLPEKGAWMGDIEWVAFEVNQEDDSEDEDDDEEDDDGSDTNDILRGMSALKLGSVPQPLGRVHADQHSSLSLLEYLLRLAALQTFEQQSHMNLTDEHIVLFLRDDNPASRTQQPTLDGDRTIRRQSSQTSISSDFSARLAPQHFPMSPPQSDDHHTPIAPSSSPTPTSPANRNPRTYLDRAMAPDYDPMTLVTPPANRRLTRNHPAHRKKSPLLPVKRGSSATATFKTSSAPSSLQKQFPAVPKLGPGSEESTNHDRNSGGGEGGDTRNLLGSPLVGKQGSLPQRRVVSLRNQKGKNGKG